MTPAYLHSPPSPFPFIELKEDQQLQFSSSSTQRPPHQASSSSSLSPPIFFNISHEDQGANHPREPQKKQHKADHKFILHGGSREHEVIPSWVHHPSIDTTKDHSRGSSSSSSSICKIEVEAEDERDRYESTKWMTSKMRWSQKFQDHEKNNGETNTIVRICSDCKTTKTPLWRGGPQGPKSLCNACGIRQRKARRAMITAAAAANGTVLAMDSPTRTKVKIKENKWRTSDKKPFKIYSPPQGGEKISFEDFALSLSKNLTFQRAFPKDEEDAAILLMALSCGLLHG